MALVELRISNLAILDSVRVEPGPGLVALTGETGSGKSLCIAALRLALGGRVDPELVRPACDSAGAAAVFDVVPAEVSALLDSHGIDGDDLLTLTRELRPGGRGACRVNGALVSQAVLREVGEALVEVTAQGESHRLLQPARQRRLLDAYAGAPADHARAAVAAALLERREAEAALYAARAAAARGADEVEAAAAVVAELEPLGLRDGEDAELTAERQRLRHAAELAAAAGAVHVACAGTEDAAGAAAVVQAAGQGGRSAASVDPDVAGLVAECDELAERLRDLGARARGVEAACEADGARLAAVEGRLDVLDRVRRRHGGSVSAAVEALAAARTILAEASGDDDDQRSLEARLDTAGAALADTAAHLRVVRARAAAELEAAVTAQLRLLRLPQARFRIVLGRTPDQAGPVVIDGVRVGCGPEGADSVEFRLATAADGVPLPIDQAASGGELSRLALALRAVVASADDCLTLVLDEVDSGLGGETAARVGEVLASASSGRQVIVITHRAEIAARASSHVVVAREDRPRAGVHVRATTVTGDARVAEVARLLSGRSTGAALARARELLVEGSAGEPRRSQRAPARTIARR